MSEHKQKKTDKSPEKKNKKTGGQPTPAQDNPVPRSGDLLRQARLEKKLDLDEISATINVRVAQLKAIEDGHIDQLPGMTYATGFVKSYAMLLKLDPVEIVNKFKAEHGASAPRPELHFPEPIAESKMPDPVILGAAALAVAALLIVWAVFSGGADGKAQTVAAIPPPPENSTLLAPTGLTDTSAVTGDVLSPATSGEIPAPGSPIATGPLKGQVTPLSSVVAAMPQTTTPPPAETAAVTVDAAATAQSPTPGGAAPDEAAADAASVAVAPVTAPRPRVAPQDNGLNVINVRRGRSRITLQAHQSTWVQISDASQSTVLKKVLRPGDEYFVPDQPGLTMVTSNAGGLDVIVDGKKVQSLGHSGEIIRGIELDPEDLKTKKVRTRY
jgi:cytoskeleton protein RodZ